MNSSLALKQIMQTAGMWRWSNEAESQNGTPDHGRPISSLSPLFTVDPIDQSGDTLEPLTS